MATTMVHLHQKRNNTRSIKCVTPTPVTETEEDMHPNQEPRCNVIFLQTEKTNGIIYSDQTCHLTASPTKESKYVMIVYCMEENSILYQPIKTKPETKLVTAYTKIQYNPVKRGFKPQLHPLEN